MSDREENDDSNNCGKELTSFKYARLVPCDVELSFSFYKDLLTSKSLNMEKHIFMARNNLF